MAADEKPEASSAAKGKSGGKAVAGGDVTEAASYKSDPANPESAMVYAPEVAEGSTADPDTDVELKPGEKAAQFESHVWVNSPEKIAERIEKEQEEGLTADEAARVQQKAANKLEFQRVTAPVSEETDEEKLEAQKKQQAAVEAIREAVVTGALKAT